MGWGESTKVSRITAEVERADETVPSERECERIEEMTRWLDGLASPEEITMLESIVERARAWRRRRF